MQETSPVGNRKRGRPSEDEREQRKAAILDAAVQLFIRNGYGQATIDQLAAAAQVTKRTIYTYFGDKSEVFTAVIERFRQESVASGPSRDESLLELSARMVHTLHSDEAVGLHRLMIAEARHFSTLAAAFYASGPQGYIELIASRLPGAQDTAVTSRTSEAVFGLLLGEAHRRRLLGLTPAPGKVEARQLATDSLGLLGLLAPSS